MKSPYVSELQPNQVVTATFLVQHKEIRQKKTGEPYLSLLLSDRTGELDAKMWDNAAEVIETFDRDDFVRVRGLLQIFHNRPQFSVHKVQRVGGADVDTADFFPASERNPEEMFAELRDVIAGVSNPYLRALLEGIFSKDDVAKRFRIAPAAKSIHHAYLGGLLEHVLSLCNLCRRTAGLYRDIDVDLLLTGAILHDVGKIYELTYDRSFAYSSDGQLLGHIIIALRMIGDETCRIPGFPVELRTLIDHMIVSHHGELAFGSPKVPLFPEAMLLHHLDNLDSKMEAMRSVLQRDRQVAGCWTSYSVSLDRPVLKKLSYLAPPAPAPASEAAPAQASPANSVFGAKLQQAISSSTHSGEEPRKE